MRAYLWILICPAMLACGSKIDVDSQQPEPTHSEDVQNGCQDSATGCAPADTQPDDSTPNAEPQPVQTQPMRRFAEPQQTGSRLNFYATYYYLPVVDNQSGSYPLLAKDGGSLGVSVSQRVWCDAAMEGSIAIRNKDGSVSTYNYAGVGNYSQVDCSPYFDHPASERVRFKKTEAPFGLGVQNFELVPYRSIATAPSHIPTGSVVYIPEARGVVVTLPSGEKWEHDGYFFAADVGGKIEPGHIDVFIGPATKNPFSFVTSNAKDRKAAFIITDTAIQADLNKQHRRAKATSQ